MKTDDQAVRWTRVILGLICGVLATGPMTAAMVLWHRRLPEREKYPLPPREITGAVMDKAGVSATAVQLSAATLVAHFAYGGAAGGLYPRYGDGMENAEAQSRRERRGMEKKPLLHRFTQQVNIFGADMTP